MSILERITEKEITEWLNERKKADGLTAISGHSNEAHNYWFVHSGSFCSHGETLHDAISDLRQKLNAPRDQMIREKRDEAARLLREAEELDGGN